MLIKPITDNRDLEEIAKNFPKISGLLELAEQSLSLKATFLGRRSNEYNFYVLGKGKRDEIIRKADRYFTRWYFHPSWCPELEKEEKEEVAHINRHTFRLSLQRLYLKQYKNECQILLLGKETASGNCKAVYGHLFR